MKVLVADDEAGVRDIIEKLLFRLGHEATVVEDGRKAFDEATTNNYDLIITDIRMPRLNGIELLKAVKTTCIETDVILLTGYYDMDVSIMALKNGASDFLIKPVDLNELSDAINLIEKKRNQLRSSEAREKIKNQTRRLSDLLFVAGGIAHEINNPNTFIKGNVETLEKFWEIIHPYIMKSIKEGIEPPAKLEYIIQEVPQLLKAAQKGSDRIRQITENMRTFASAEENSRIFPIDLNICIKEALDDSVDELKEIGLELTLSPDLPRVVINEKLLREIIWELLNNAKNALQTTESPIIEITSQSLNDNEVMLSIKDNGEGISSENRDKIFTPFFSTHPRIGRPGLGLSKVYAIVMQSGGSVSFSNEGKRGTRFTVVLPAAGARSIQ